MRFSDVVHGKWVAFHHTGSSASGKTQLWAVTGSGGDEDKIGKIIWSASWRQYVFVSEFATYSPACLREIANFVERMTVEHRQQAVSTREKSTLSHARAELRGLEPAAIGLAR